MKEHELIQYLSILEKPTKGAIRAFAERNNLVAYLAESYQHPQEDYVLASSVFPIFVVADGVTLDIKKLIERNTKYLNPSPAGEVARIFCETVIRSAVERYEVFSIEDIARVFRDANAAVGEYNEKIGKSDISGNVTGFYAATGSFVVIKGSKAYWATICDSFVAHFDKKMVTKFMSSGSCKPYAVINGEKRMVDYLESGVFDLKDGDRVFLFTDGFVPYVKRLDFLELFAEWSGNLKGRIAEFSKEMNLKDPEKYGHERSFIAISFHFNEWDT